MSIVKWQHAETSIAFVSRSHSPRSETSVFQGMDCSVGRDAGTAANLTLSYQFSPTGQQTWPAAVAYFDRFPTSLIEPA